MWTYRRDFRERAYWLDVSFVSSQLTLFSLPLSSWQIFGFYLITIDFTQVISDSVTTDGGRSQDNTGGDRTILLHAVIELIDFHWLLVILLVITSQTSNTLSLPICPKINISFLYDQKTWLVIIIICYSSINLLCTWAWGNIKNNFFSDELPSWKILLQLQHNLIQRVVII